MKQKLSKSQVIMERFQQEIPVRPANFRQSEYVIERMAALTAKVAQFSELFSQAHPSCHWKHHETECKTEKKLFIFGPTVWHLFVSKFSRPDTLP